jgi:hypothetical protein
VYPSTAKQRLWLTYLGYDVPATADTDDIRALLEDAKNSGRYQSSVTGRQIQLAQYLGIPFVDNGSCHEIAGLLYELLLLRAWVYSVWRVRLGSNCGQYDGLGLPDVVAVTIAREMNRAGLLERVKSYSTTDGRESDVFYRMSKSAQTCSAFTFVAERLPIAPLLPTRSPREGNRRPRRRPQNAAVAGRGCVVGVLAVCCTAFVIVVVLM